ncbi:MAG: GNAT family N-acetyltransferase [Deltaproteobacteria bacterium]|nr:GNAT family N-acetyltransferase [Deltaproteobacteria bacterium]
MKDGLNDIQYTGRVPGAIGLITACHAAYYHENRGLDLSFEIQVASELAAFLDRFDPARDGLWLAWSGDAFAGSVAVDGSESRGREARLRWFIVEPDFQGRGIGGNLIQRAVSFCEDAGHARLFLWTFQGLEQARSLYEKAGFRLSQEHEVTRWGQQILEQRFDLPLKA